MAASDLVLGITGASGTPYAVRFLQVLLEVRRTVHLVISPAAAQVLELELGRRVNLQAFNPAELMGNKISPEAAASIRYHQFLDFKAGIASGSFLTAGMVVCPCSMGTVAAIANGFSDNLIHRAADVHLKERRKLILVPRETPLGVVQLRNLTRCVEAGAVVLPAMPAFYTRPQTIDDMINFIVGRICDQLGIEHHLFQRWGQDE
jgi:4-hydroxy-3-polyprenylbenzoate decarboxylase